MKKLLNILIIVSLAVLVTVPIVVAAANNADPGKKCNTVSVKDGSTGQWVNKSQPTGQCKARFKSNSTTKPLLYSDADCFCCGNCSLPDFVVAIVQIAKYIFGISGSLALLMFIVGGIQWVMSAGSAEKIKKGRDTLIHAGIGIAIIFGAWMLVNTILGALTGQLGSQKGTDIFFNTNWAVEWSTQKKRD